MKTSVSDPGNCTSPIFSNAARLFLPLVLLASLSTPAHSATVSAAGIPAELERASTLREAGEFHDARAIYESLLPALQARPPGNELGESLLGLSLIENAEGHYEKAAVLAHRGAAVFQKLGDRDGQARALNDAGFARMNAGSYAEAAQDLDLGLRLSGHSGVAKTSVFILNNLGSVYYYQAKYSESFRAYDAALQRVQQSASESWAPYWRQVTLMNEAALYLKIGDDARALSIYTELKQSPVPLKRRTLAYLYSNLGVLYRHLGDSQKALDAYRDAAQAYSLEHDFDGELGVLKNTGIVLALNLGRLQDALDTFTRALALAEKTKNRREAMHAVLYRAATLSRMGRLPEAKGQFEEALRAAVALGTVEEQWKALYGLGQIAEAEQQATVAEAKYREAISRIESMRSKIQLSRLKSDFLADKRDVYDGIIRLLLVRNDAATAFEYMERSRARVFQDRFYAGTGSAGPKAMTLRSVQQQLNPSTALIEFWIGPGIVAAVWVTPHSEGIAQRPISAAELSALGRVIDGLPDSLAAHSRAAFDVVDTIVPKGIAPLSDVRYPHILLVPDGILSRVPFELLSTPGSTTLLVERHDVTYLPGAVLLQRRDGQRTARFQFPWRQELTAFGDPVLAAHGRDLVAAPYGGDRSTLPGSAAEIDEITRMSWGRTRTFVGAADRKPDFLASANSAPMLHISTHATADMDNPERSRLLFSPDDPSQPNNYLFLKELYDLDLRGTTLVTLSACDTERGKLVPGEGVQAFSRALLAAGTTSAVTTLWRVPDGPTADFMKQFYYFLLVKHETKGQALRLAKLDFLHSGTPLSHPRYWAAFVLHGDGAAPVPRFIRWREMFLPLPILVLLVVLFLRRRRKEQIAPLPSGVG